MGARGGWFAGCGLNSYPHRDAAEVGYGYNAKVAPAALPVLIEPQQSMEAKRRRKPFDAATLAAIEIDHDAGELTLEAIGKKYGCSGANICKLAKLHGWKRRRPPDAAVPPPPRRTPRNPRTVMRRRMCKVINGKLKEMEQGMQSGELSADDLERGAKVVTSMLGLHKLGAPEEDKVRDAQSTNAGAKDDVERLQREIIERFERIQRRREAERGSA